MILTNLLPATLYQYNRNNEKNPYDDEDIQTINIKVCPYNVDTLDRMGVYTHPEATGYFIVKGNVDIQTGDQIKFRGEKHTILEVKDNWIWNKVENITIIVK